MSIRTIDKQREYIRVNNPDLYHILRKMQHNVYGEPYEVDEYYGYIVSHETGKRIEIEDKYEAFRIAYLKNAKWITNNAPHIHLPTEGTYEDKWLWSIAEGVLIRIYPDTNKDNE